MILGAVASFFKRCDVSDGNFVDFAKDGNTLVCLSQNPSAHNLIRAQLQFRRTEFLQGFERTLAIKAGNPVVRSELCDLFDVDAWGRTVIRLGSFRKICKLFREAGLECRIFDYSPPPANPLAYEIRYDLLEKIQFEGRQREIFLKMLAERMGILVAATGFGKTFLIRCLAQVMSRATIDIVSLGQELLFETIYPDLAVNGVNVGRVSGKFKSRGERVTVVSGDSVHKRSGDVDILIVDEAHGMASKTRMPKLARYNRAWSYAFTATLERPDGAHQQLFPVFGDVLAEVSYEDAVAQNRVTPCVVIWRYVRMPSNPMDLLPPTAREDEKERTAVWQNRIRNQMIVEDMRRYQSEQVLTTCRTTEHVMAIRQLAPEFTPVFAAENMTDSEYARYVSMGCLSRDEFLPVPEQRGRITRDFSAGVLRKAIVTTLWNQGVNFNELSVLVQAAGHQSSTATVQAGGRPGRKHPDKPYSIIHEYWDCFDESREKRAKQRAKDYAKLGFEQYIMQHDGSLQPFTSFLPRQRRRA